MRSLLTLFVLLSTVLLAACGDNQTTNDKASNVVDLTDGTELKLPSRPEGFKACGKTRPEVCTMIYAPVCATLKNGKQVTYSSGCNACARDDVVGYVPDSCPADI